MSSLLFTVDGIPVYETVTSSVFDNQIEYNTLITAESSESLVDLQGVNGVTGSIGFASQGIFYANLETINDDVPVASAVIYGTDGTPGGTGVLLDAPGAVTDFVYNDYEAVFQNLIIHTTSNGPIDPPTITYETKVYVTNGTSGGTHLEWDFQNTDLVKSLPTPLLSQASAISVTAGSVAAVPGIGALQINTGGSPFLATVTAALGTVATSGNQGTISGAGTASMAFAGTIDQVNADLAGLTFAAGTALGTGTVSVVATFDSVKSPTETSNVIVTANPPLLANQTPNQSWTQGHVISFEVPAATFTDPQGEALSYQATQSDGAALPAWLSFNASTETFTGTVPGGPETFNVKVLATDASGLSTAEIFAVTVPNVPQLTPAVSDFNGDGISDILWQNTDGAVGTWLMNGTTPTSEQTVGSSPSSWSIAGVGDFNGDGDADILWRNTNGQVGVWFAVGGTFSDEVVGDAPSPWWIAGIGDFNGDGDDDILWRNTDGQVGVWLMNGGTATSEEVVGSAPSSWSIAGVGDFNGDSDADILWQNANGQVGIWLMDGTTPTTEKTIGTAASGWSIAGVGDFNGDGDADILWRNTTNGEVGIWLTDGTTVLSEQVIGDAPSSWSIVGVGDFNGDGKSDILWRNTNGQIAEWLMNGTTVTSEQVIGRAPSSWTVAAHT
jgi:hypothetical protein